MGRAAFGGLPHSLLTGVTQLIEIDGSSACSRGQGTRWDFRPGRSEKRCFVGRRLRRRPTKHPFLFASLDTPLRGYSGCELRESCY